MQLKFLTTNHPKSSLPFSKIIIKHKLSNIKTFIILTKSNSFNNTTKLLNITQPTLTQKIKKIKKNLHIQLFKHTTHKITLTKTKKKLLPKTQKLIKKFNKTLFNIHNINTYHHNIITLTYIPTTIFYFLPLTINKFNKLYPNIKIQILKQNTNNYIKSILYNKSNFNININNITNSSINFTPLINKPFILTYQHNHPLTKKQLIK